LYYLLPPQRDVCDRLRHLSKFYLPATRTARSSNSFIVYGLKLTITYKYQSPISNDINILCVVYVFYFVALDVSLGFHFLFCVCYVNPAEQILND